MAAAAAAMIPGIGQGISMMLQRLIGAAERRDTATHLYRATSGEDSTLGSFTNIGLSTAEANEKQAKYIRDNVDLRREDLYFEKGFNLSTETISTLLRSTRNEITNEGSAQLGIGYLNNLNNFSDRKNVRAYSDEYLKLLVELNEKQLEVSGQVNTAVNGKIIAGIAGLSEDFQNPTVLASVVDKLQKGLSTASTPQMEALQYYVLGNLYPHLEGDNWEIAKIRANPFAPVIGEDGEPIKGSEGEYLKALILELSSTGRTDVEGYFNVANQFGFKPSELVENLVEGIRSGQYDNNVKLLKEDFNKAASWGLENEAIAATSKFQEGSAATEDLYAEMGEPIANLFNGLGEKVRGVVGEFEGLLNGTKSLTEAMSGMTKIILGISQNDPRTSVEYASDFAKNHFQLKNMGITAINPAIGFAYDIYTTNQEGKNLVKDKNGNYVKNIPNNNKVTTTSKK